MFSFLFNSIFILFIKKVMFFVLCVCVFVCEIANHLMAASSYSITLAS